jgi:DNA replication protein DnaC
MPAVCPQCNGSGWKIVEKDELSGAVRCECAAEERAVRALGGADIPPLYASASFENFSLGNHPIVRPQLQQVFVEVKAFARDFPATQYPGLLLMGDTGTGKTHLAVAAFRAILARGFEGLFFDYQNLLDRIRSSYDPASNTSDKEAYRTAMEKEVLLLDDLGAHRVTDWTEDTVTSILTYRCNNRKPLIATTNLIDPELGFKGDHRPRLAEQIGLRARSRLFEMCKVIRMPVMDDYRVRRQAH